MAQLVNRSGDRAAVSEISDAVDCQICPVNQNEAIYYSISVTECFCISFEKKERKIMGIMEWLSRDMYKIIFSNSA